MAPSLLSDPNIYGNSNSDPSWPLLAKKNPQDFILEANNWLVLGAVREIQPFLPFQVRSLNHCHNDASRLFPFLLFIDHEVGVSLGKSVLTLEILLT